MARELVFRISFPLKYDIESNLDTDTLTQKLSRTYISVAEGLEPWKRHLARLQYAWDGDEEDEESHA